MSLSAFVLLVFGVCGLVLLVWWVMLKALTSKQSGHKGPVENAAKARHRGGYEPRGDDHADRHRDHWHDDLLHVSAANAELDTAEALDSSAAEDIRRSAVQGADIGLSSGSEAAPQSPSQGSGSSSGHDSSSSGSSDNASSDSWSSSDSSSSSSSDPSSSSSDW